MFEDRSYKRTFYSAPQSVTSLVAAFLEPTLSVLTYVAMSRVFGEPIVRSSLTLCLLTFALTFPGRNRFRDNLLAAGVDIFTSWIVLLVVLGLCGYATRSLGYFEDRVLMAWALLTPLLQWGAAAVGHNLLRHQEALPHARRTAVIVGGGPLGVKVARALTAGHDRGTDFLGFFDDRTDNRVDGEASDKLLGGLKHVAAYVSAHGVRDVYITLPLGSQPRIVELLEQVQGTTASLFFVPDVFGITIIQGRFQDLNGVPVVGICETPFTGTNELAKRISDIVLASIILVLISPILLVLAVGVKLSSPGPMIFKQRRNGLDGSEIVVYKFRSMRAMDDGKVVRQATKDDPRITPFGAFLRKSSLDELPQLFNVVRGEMSLVGPRPLVVDEDQHVRGWYRRRLELMPGITGPWQILGPARVPLREMGAMDYLYVANWSLWGDVKILLRTVGHVLARRGL